MVQIVVVGCGWVGLATAVSLARAGHQVVCTDVDGNRVRELGAGRLPFFEPGLQEVFRQVLDDGCLEVTSDTAGAVGSTEFVFLCVGTPPREDGSMDNAHLVDAAHDVARGLGRSSGRTVVVTKSTVLPGTTEGVIRPILRKFVPAEVVGLAVNPEFLREGRALHDAEHPDRIVLGSDGQETSAAMRALHRGVACPVFETDLRTAEMIKYSTNAFLATKITFANELANLCQILGVSFDEVVRGLVLDPRANPQFLVPGVGFGGSCLPKDVRALTVAAQARGYDAELLKTVLALNEKQYLQAIRLLEKEVGSLREKRIALLGLTFKGGAGDIRGSRAIPLANGLLERGATVVVYDPVAVQDFLNAVPGVYAVSTLEEALRGADGCIVQADWPEFSSIAGQDFLRLMRTPVVVDCRRILDTERMSGIRLRRIGEP